MVRLIDSTPIPLGKLCDWAKSNGRIRGMKMHVVYDPQADCPRILDITDANVNDAQIGRTIDHRDRRHLRVRQGLLPLRLVDAPSPTPQSFFVTRPKIQHGARSGAQSVPSQSAQGDGFTVLEDSEVSFASKGDSKLPIALRRVTRPASRTATPSRC